MRVPLTRYSLASSVLLAIAGIICAFMTFFGAMAGGWGMPDLSYHGICLLISLLIFELCFPVFILMLVSIRIGSPAMWCLVVCQFLIALLTGGETIGFAFPIFVVALIAQAVLNRQPATLMSAQADTQ